MKIVKPMLIGAKAAPFDDSDWIYELKFDGIRCIAYLNEDTRLINKRQLNVTSIYPELSRLHQYVKKPCILDGEVVAFYNGKPDFSRIQRRALMGNKFKIQTLAEKEPVTFVAFDLLFLDGDWITECGLLERKSRLEQMIMPWERLILSRYIDTQGIALYSMAEKEGLEGVVAKRKDSLYYFAKRTRDWVKIKNLQDDDFVVCGYLKKSNRMNLVLGQYDDAGELRYKGHVPIALTGADFQLVKQQKKLEQALFSEKGEKGATIWVEPKLVCTVEYMERTASGLLRQPVYRGIRMDKSAADCKYEK